MPISHTKLIAKQKLYSSLNSTVLWDWSFYFQKVKESFFSRIPGKKMVEEKSFLSFFFSYVLFLE